MVVVVVVVVVVVFVVVVVLRSTGVPVECAIFIPLS